MAATDPQDAARCAATPGKISWNAPVKEARMRRFNSQIHSVPQASARYQKRNQASDFTFSFPAADGSSLRGTSIHALTFLPLSPT